MFKNTEFMTAREKELALKHWEKFLKQGLQKHHFTKRLYHHLYLHCGFIAHYDLSGFYSTYFEAGQDTERFFKHFCIQSAQNHGANIDYGDLNTAMRAVYRQYQNTIEKQAEDNIARVITLLDECIERAKTDLGFAKTFLGKFRFHEGDLLCLRK